METLSTYQALFYGKDKHRLTAFVNKGNVCHLSMCVLFDLLNKEVDIPHSLKGAVATTNEVSSCLPSYSLPSGMEGQSSLQYIIMSTVAATA